MNKTFFNPAKLLLIPFSLSIVILLAACSGSSSTEANQNNEEVFTLKAATILEETNIFTEPLQIFKDIVEKESDGRIKIDYIGGPETIPAFNQGEAIQNGALDISLNFSSYYAELVPEALALNFSELTYEEELESGGWDYLNEQHKHMNAVTLGRVFEMQDGLYTTKKVESTNDLSGLRIRGTTKYVPTFEAFGAEVISIEGGEVYNALERGMVDGVTWAALGISDLGLEEEINYQIFPKFNRIESIWLMNLDAYNNLPEELQKIVKEAAIETYYQSEKVLQEAQEEELQLLENVGVESITLTDSDTFLERAVDASWEWLGSRVNEPGELEKYFRK